MTEREIELARQLLLANAEYLSKNSVIPSHVITTRWCIDLAIAFYKRVDEITADRKDKDEKARLEAIKAINEMGLNRFL